MGSSRVSVVVDEYVADLVRRKVSKDHIQGYAYILRRFQAAIYNDVYMSQVTSQDMKKFFYGGRINNHVFRGLAVSQRDGGEIAGSSWNAYRRLMIKFCKDVGRADLMSEVPERKVADPDRIILSEEQMETLIETSPDTFEAALNAVCVDYGPRAGEVRRLLISDYVRTRGVIRLTVTKSRKRETTVFEHDMTPDCGRRIDAWMRDYAAHFGMTFEQLLDEGRDWRMFPRRKRMGNGKYLIRQHLPFMQIWDVIQRGLKRLGYSEERIKGNGIHCSRRSTGRALRESTGDTRQVTALLHHASEKTTEIYLGLERDRDKVNAGLKAGGWRGQYVARKGGTVTPIREAGRDRSA